MGGEALPTAGLDELRMANTAIDNDKDGKDNPQAAINVRQLAELAAAAAHRKSLDQDVVLGGGNGRTPSSRRQVTRYSSSGVPSRSNSSGLRSMSRSFGNERTMVSRTSSMHSPRQRGVHRSASSDVSPMLSKSYARSGSFQRSDQPTHGSDASSSRLAPDRGVRRAQSSLASSGARHAPERRSIRRSDSLAEPSRRGVGRTCSQNSLLHMSQNASSDAGSLRPYRGREGLVNTSIKRTDSLSSSRGQSINLLRRSIDERSLGEMSGFSMTTMDSVNLRKQQIVADPIDDAATYRGDDAESYADHDSVSMATNDMGTRCLVEHIPVRNPNHIPYDGVSVADSVVSGIDSLPNGGSPHHQRIVEDTRYLEDDTNHSRPNQIACDAISLSTIGAEIDEIDESSYLDDDDHDSTLHEEIEGFDEDDDIEEESDEDDD